MRFHANLVDKKNLVYTVVVLVLLSGFNIAVFGQDENNCPNCPCCAKPARCTGVAYSPHCKASPTCTCDCTDASCDCYKNVCVIDCYDVPEKAKNKSLQVGLLTLSLIKNEQVTEQQLTDPNNRIKYAQLLEKLLNNKISDDTYEVEYLNKKVQIGFTKKGLQFVNEFKENLANGKPNSPGKRQNIFQIIGKTMKEVFT
jgi:hypothetical protein